ncbi:MAG TPA: hypothetical protein VK995_00660 [Oceanipulchritudo sp.]|nr:hypothetical protein [Oceanipulchritudo sp.]
MRVKLTPIFLPEVAVESNPVPAAVAVAEEEELPEPDEFLSEGSVSEPDEFPLDDIQLEYEPLPELELEPLESASEEAAGPRQDEPLLPLNEAVARIPEELRQQMETLLRAEFREVHRWKGE